jgi:hypothetical protein
MTTQANERKTCQEIENLWAEHQKLLQDWYKGKRTTKEVTDSAEKLPKRCSPNDWAAEPARSVRDILDGELPPGLPKRTTGIDGR